MPSTSDHELIWRLAEHASGHLSRSARSAIFILIGVGDDLAAMESLLQSYRDSHRALPMDLAERVITYIARYRGNSDEPRLRDLVMTVTANSFQSRTAHNSRRVSTAKNGDHDEDEVHRDLRC